MTEDDLEQEQQDERADDSDREQGGHDSRIESGLRVVAAAAGEGGGFKKGGRGSLHWRNEQGREVVFIISTRCVMQNWRCLRRCPKTAGIYDASAELRKRVDQ